LASIVEWTTMLPLSALPIGIVFPAPDKAIRLRGGVSLHLVGDEGVLLDASSQRLYRVNTTGAFIWCCLEDGVPPEEGAARLRQTFNTTPHEARRYVAEAVAEWTALGFVEHDDRSPADVAAKAPPADQVSSPSQMEEEPFVAVSERNYRLLDTDFRVRFASRVTEAEIDPFLAPLAELFPHATNAVVIDVRERGDRRALYHGKRIIERWAAADEIVPVAKIALVTFALERSQDFGALHAGAVCRRAGAPCVIIAGVSGAGKSTLTAALAAAGFISLGDDTIVLARDTLAVRGVPFGICLKEGAWSLLSERLPGLGAQPVHQRLDGKRVRYFVPENSATRLDRSARNPVCAIVFPNRIESGPSCLVRVSSADALSRLASEFCPLGEVLDSEKVERLIRWVNGVACLELRYSTLDEGIKRVGELCT
jgi:hypothetical protein